MAKNNDQRGQLAWFATQIREEILLITDQIQDMSSNYVAVYWMGRLTDSAESNSLITYRGRVYCICRSNTEGYMN
jgi:hypothetical protein